MPMFKTESKVTIMVKAHICSNNKDRENILVQPGFLKLLSYHNDSHLPGI